MSKGYLDKPIRFPILLKLTNGVSVTALKEKVLTKVYKKSYHSKEFINATIIDAQGTNYIIRDVINLGYTNLLWGLDQFLGQQVYVGLKLTKIKDLTLEEFKLEAIKIVKANKEYYLSAGLNIKEVINNINKAPEVEEISTLLLP